jgi:hypothetical protein
MAVAVAALVALVAPALALEPALVALGFTPR